MRAIFHSFERHSEGDVIQIVGDSLHHLTVARVRENEKLLLLNGKGQRLLGFIQSLSKKSVDIQIISVENAKAQADAKAYELSAMMKAFAGIDSNVMQSLANMGMKPDKLIAIAFQELADKADKIGQLNISPDLLQGLLQGNDK